MCVKNKVVALIIILMLSLSSFNLLTVLFVFWFIIVRYKHGKIIILCVMLASF